MKNGKKISIRNVSVLWKIMTAAFVGVIIFFVASKFASAETVSVTITGDNLNDGTWEVGSNPVKWTASAYDSDSDRYLSLEDGGSIVWESSDRSIVDISQSSQGIESTVV